ncbi:MAG: hypothetical protein Q4G40_03945 [Brachybacterium sp.]|nr:hypothetical protein [Brachybacterium sp.]
MVDDHEDMWPHTSRFTLLWHPDDYAGQKWIRVQATQLEDHQARTRRDKKKILEGWIDLLSHGETGVTHLMLDSRVPQDLLAAVQGLTALRWLDVKWGPYDDLDPLRSLEQLRLLRLGGATKIVSLEPLESLESFSQFDLSNAFRLDLTEVSRLRRLRELWLGTGIGTDRPLKIESLDWLRPLSDLEVLHFVNSHLVEPDLSVVAGLANLREFSMPLRRRDRPQVEAIAATGHPAFVTLAVEFSASWDYGDV